MNLEFPGHWGGIYVQDKWINEVEKELNLNNETH